MQKPQKPEHCANCGAAIPPKASACPECGADERTGWAEQDIYDGLDLPADDETQSHDTRSRKNREGHRWLWLYVGIVLVLLLILGVLRIRF